jgi:hypothetical protein
VTLHSPYTDLRVGGPGLSSRPRRA